MSRLILFIIGMTILIGSEMMKVYYIMPFPGSQQDESIALAYFIHQYIWFFRVVGFGLIVYPAYTFIRSQVIWIRWPAVVVLAFWIFVVYIFNFRFLAQEMFLQPEVKLMYGMEMNKVPSNNLVIGVSINGESKAYPIEIIGYHHQVRDTIGGQLVMVTYCTVCRTGRIFSPIVNGTPETFRLVGMDHFNAMFEDTRTGSWWRQVNGEAVTGEMKGNFLTEISAEQMSLGAWINIHPDTKVLQPDPHFSEAYKGLTLYDEGKERNSLERKDSLSWKEKSWVVGVQIGIEARAYDWIELISAEVINDRLANVPLLVAIESDSVNFHVWKRPDSLTFERNDQSTLTDINTHSTWNWNGLCTEGVLRGSQLEWQQSYQEYWHSWRTFRPQSTRYPSTETARN